MDANAQYELYLIKKELQDVITELDSIANGVRRDFAGIGNDKCANSIRNARDHYKEVKAQLEKMDMSALSDEFIAAKQAAEKKAASQPAKPAANKPAASKPASSTSSSKSTAKASSGSSSKNTSGNNQKNVIDTVTDVVKDTVDAIKGAFSWLSK